MDNPHTSALAARHAGIEAKLTSERSRPNPDAARLGELKKQKLRLKDQISRL